MESSPPNPKYPIACPVCRNNAGYPFRASTQVGKGNIIAVHLRCRACGHEWQSEVTTT